MARLRIRRMPPNTYQLLLNLTNRHIHVQLVDRQGGRVVLAAHTTEPRVRQRIVGATESTPGRYPTASVEAAGMVGSVFAERATQAGISTVYWSSPGRYHGKIKAFIDAVRGGGIATKRPIPTDLPKVPPLPGSGSPPPASPPPQP